MNKHTKGEWIIEPNNERQLAISSNNRALAFLPLLHPEVEANSKLIAAAPDLLKALQALVGIEVWITDRQMKEHFQNVVYPAIKKATE